jgi:radical SAM superfamily enzyme YgiQ (UPF0313 family)
MAHGAFKVFLVNPAPAAERLGWSFITPRALPVLAAVTPDNGSVSSLKAVDQAIDEFPFDEIEPGDLVGVSIHTFNAIHGYALARELRKRNATVVFGGPHASIFPDEALKHGDAVCTGDGEVAWGALLDDYANGALQRVYKGGRVPGDRFVPARWDVMKLDRYLLASIQTVRGCPKQCSFCSVWVQDGRVPRLRSNDAIVTELLYLYREGFRLVMFADDNFYPYTRADIEQAKTPEARRQLEEGYEERLDLLKRLAVDVPGDMHFCTQITMEVADDPEYLAAMKRGRIAGALIGIETITEAGLLATKKLFNSSGAQLAPKLETIRRQGFPYILGSFIFGIESDTPESVEETIRFARDCGIALAQFIPMTPLPGTVDFHMLRRGKKVLRLVKEDYDYWLDPQHPRILYEHPHLSAAEIESGIERAWRAFYSMSAILKRARHFGLVGQPRKLLAYLVICRGLLTRYKRYGLSADSAARGTNRKLAALLGRLALMLMKRRPAPVPVGGY